MIRKLETYERITCILDTVETLEVDYQEEGVPLEQIIDHVTDEGFDRNEVIRDIENLNEYVGHLDSPQPKRYVRC